MHYPPNVSFLPWPAMSPDLNPIEHVLDMLYRRVHAVEPRGQNCIYIEQNKNKSSNKQKNKATIIIFARISIIKH